MQFYTYIWFRKDGSPWYVGKGSGNRAYQRCKGHWAPKDTELIKVQQWPDEETAFAFEIYLIDFYGRKDLGTGTLHNHTYGGENPPVTFSKPWLKGKEPWNKGLTGIGGYTWSEESKAAKSLQMLGNKNGSVPCSEAKKKSIRIALMGHQVSEVTRAKIREKRALQTVVRGKVQAYAAATN